MMKTWSLMLVLLLAGPLNAQTVWRCGPEGKTYSDRPCTDGSTVGNSDKRSEAEVRAAREVVARDQALARELHKQNREAEKDALAHGSGLAGITAPPPRPVVKAKAPKSKSKPKKSSTEADDILKAVALGSR